MRRIIKASMEDRSSMERFQFSLRCAVCGSLWESQPVCFSKAGMQPESEGKRVIFQALYRREREEARILTCVRTVRRSYRRAASR